MDVKKELGLKIKRLTQQEGLTQEQFDEKIGIVTRTLAGIEIGESFVSAQTIENILKYTGITFEDFINYFYCFFTTYSNYRYSPNTSSR